MNISEVKRFINTGTQPLNKLIGSPDDAAAKDGSLYAKANYILDRMGKLGENVSKEIGSKHYALDDTNILYEIPETKVVEGYNLPASDGLLFFQNVYRRQTITVKLAEFTPKYNGWLKFSYSANAGDSGYKKNDSSRMYNHCDLKFIAFNFADWLHDFVYVDISKWQTDFISRVGPYSSTGSILKNFTKYNYNWITGSLLKFATRKGIISDTFKSMDDRDSFIEFFTDDYTNFHDTVAAPALLSYYTNPSPKYGMSNFEDEFTVFVTAGYPVIIASVMAFSRNNNPSSAIECQVFDSGIVDATASLKVYGKEVNGYGDGE